MRLLKINNTEVDIDNQTAIGITLQTYDIKQPGKRFINVSNTFSIPKTINNLAIWGNPTDPQTTSTKVYESASCDYWIENEQLIKSAKVKIVSIGSRIELFIFEKNDLWDSLKSVKWSAFINSFISWLQTNKGYPSIASPINYSELQTLVGELTTSTEEIHLPFYFGQLANVEESGSYLEDITTIRVSDIITAGFFVDIERNGGHFTIFCKTIFEYIEDTYSVNFLTGGGQMIGNLWDDVYANSLQVVAQSLMFFKKTLSDEFYLGAWNKFDPLKDIVDKGEKTLYDFVNSFFQQFNVLKDEFYVDGVYTVRLARYDQLETDAYVVDFSDNITEDIIYKPFVEGIAQNNYIKYKSIYENGDPLISSKNITSQNVNLDVTADMFEIDAHIPAFIEITDGVVPDLSTKESFKTFVFLIDDELTTDDISVQAEYKVLGLNSLYVGKLYKAAIYGLSGEYNFLQDNYSYPKYYEIKKWMTINDIRNFEFFKQYYIRELNGSFFVNKIKGFNPDKSKEPTTLELLKVSNRTPITPSDLDYWTDGVEDVFIDGEGDYWY